MAAVQLEYTISNGLKGNGATERTRYETIATNMLGGELDLLGMSLNNITVGTTGDDISLIITLDVDAAGEERFPTDAEKIYATQNFYTGVLEMQGPATVTAAAPVVIP